MTKQPNLRAVTRATAKAVATAKARDEAIREAAKSHTLRAIAKATGLSSARIHQIIHGR